MLDWLAFGVVQAIFASCVVAILVADRNQTPYLSIVLVSLGGLLLLINVGWYSSGGMKGRYAAYMRGGMQGFWFSTITFAEVILLGIIAWVRQRW